MPTALPVAYVVDRGAVIFRSSAGTKLAAASNGTVIAFEVDWFDEDERAGWSVVVTGLARVITDPQEEQRAAHLNIPEWVQPEGARYIRLLPSIITGRRVGKFPQRPVASTPAA
jgi:uncharacterized protein